MPLYSSQNSRFTRWHWRRRNETVRVRIAKTKPWKPRMWVDDLVFLGNLAACYWTGSICVALYKVTHILRKPGRSASWFQAPEGWHKNMFGTEDPKILDATIPNLLVLATWRKKMCAALDLCAFSVHIFTPIFFSVWTRRISTCWHRQWTETSSG
jgi:hypothetical protein